jgi:hypothetical protein
MLGGLITESMQYIDIIRNAKYWAKSGLCSSKVILSYEELE